MSKNLHHLPDIENRAQGLIIRNGEILNYAEADPAQAVDPYQLQNGLAGASVGAPDYGFIAHIIGIGEVHRTGSGIHLKACAYLDGKALRLNNG